MGGLQARAIWAVTAALATVVVAATVVFARVHGLTADDQFRLWLERQPGVLSIDRFTPRHPDSGDGVEAGTVPSPSAEVTFASPLTAARLQPFQRAFEDFAADHAQDFFTFSVQLTAGATTVVVTPKAADNDRRRTVLEAFQSVPGLVGARLAWAPWPPESTALLRGEDALLPAARRVLARLAAVRPQPRSWGAPWASAEGALTFRANGTRHQLTLATGPEPSPRAMRAFASAVRIEGARPVELAVSAADRPGSTQTRLTVGRDSPTVAETNAAVSALGFGIPAHQETLVGGEDVGYQPAFDLGAWSARTLPRVRNVPGVAMDALRLVGRPGHPASATLDVRLARGSALPALAGALPDGVDTVRAWTGSGPLDPTRPDELPPDPAQDCPSGGAVDTAYTGPAAALATAAELMTHLAATGQPTCLHWVLPYADPARTPFLQVRLPGLAAGHWQPVMDTILASRRDPGQAHPQVNLEVPGPGRHWTGQVVLSPSLREAAASSLSGTPVEMRAATAAMDPLVAYWAAHVGR